MANTDPYKATTDTDIRVQLLIKEDDVNVYRSNDSQDDIVGESHRGYECVATKLSPDKKYYYVPYYGGWISMENVDIVMENVPTYVDEKRLVNNVTYEMVEDNFGTNPDVKTNADEYVTGTSRGIDLTKFVVSTDGVFAIPYQFSQRVDRRLDGKSDGVGRKFAEKILSRNNLLYLTPGKQEFMAGATQGQKDAVMAALIDGGPGANFSDFYGRYYSLKFALDDYYKFVNPMCHSVAGLLDLQNVRMANGTTLGSYHWKNWLSSEYGTYVGAANNILFYVDSFNEASEDFGNDTRESSLVSTINGYSDTVKEINYIMNFENGEIAAFADSGLLDETRQGIQATIDTFSKGKGVIQALLGNSTTILAGGKLVFPELWNDSSFDRSFSINIKLRSPDSDPLSIYLNIIVPFIHLIALTAPRNYMDQSNGYISPFLVRAYFRGIMNIDLGIVTGLSVTRGGEGNWSLDNLPTSVDINLTIKDLYKSMYLADVNNITASKFIGNDGEMDYLMNLAGINISQESFQRQATILSAVAGGYFKTLGARADVLGENTLINLLDTVYGRYGGR